MTIKREELDRLEINFSDMKTGQQLPPVHPGEILRDEFLNPMDLSVKHLAQAIKVSPTRLYNIVNKKSSITIDTALRLGHYFGTTPEFWINPQTRYDVDIVGSKIDLDTIEPLSIKPSEIGCIHNDDQKFDLSDIKAVLWNRMFKNHIQGIAQLGGEYTVLSSSVNDKALLLAYQKKIMQVKCLPKEYDHAGGLDALEVKNGENGWMIAVPVYKVGQDGDKGAILRYFLPDGKGDKARLTDCKEIISLPIKAYAAGIARNGNGVVIAVVIEDEGGKVQFWTCENLNGQGKYNKLSEWDKRQVPKNEREDWEPDKKWGGYRNSISLINHGKHGKKICFVGLNGQTWGMFGKDWVDIYSVDLYEHAVNKQLIKKDKKHVKCDGVGAFDGPSFCWGGSARIDNKKVEILAVGCSVHDNRLIKYNKFEIDMKNINLA